MKLRWTQLALHDFETAHDDIAERDSEAAQRIAERILAATERLLEYPRIGRIGEDETTREWRVQKTPYLLVYRITGETIELLRVWHTKRE